MRQLIYTMFITNNRDSFHFWWHENFVKHQNVSKCYDQDCSNHCKRVLETAKHAYANKTKETITSQKLGSQDFRQIVNSVLKKGKSVIPPLFNSPEVLFSASDKAKLLKMFLRTLILMTQVSLYLFFHFLILNRLYDCNRLYGFSVSIPRCHKDVYVKSFFPCTARLVNSLPIECFPLTYDLSCFNCRSNRYF